MCLKLFFGIAALSIGATLGGPAHARDVFVRDKPNTKQEIQRAVDRAAPGDVIKVGPGNFAGALIFKRVTIIGSVGTIIDEGNPLIFNGTDAFDILFPEASGTTIRDMTFIGVIWGVFGFQADDVTVTNCVFLDTFHAVDNRSGNGWTISYNFIDGFIPFPPFQVLLTET